MSLVGYVVRAALTDVARRRAKAELERMRADDVSVVDVVRRVVPIVSGTVSQAARQWGDDRSLTESARSLIGAATDGELDTQRLRLMYLKRRAEQLVDEANRAQQHLRDCEREAEDIEARVEAHIEEIRVTTAERADDLVQQATAQADATVAELRQRLAETEQRADAHVSDVRRRSHLAAERAVQQAELSRTATVSDTIARLDAARISAQSANARADAAVTRAERLSDAMAKSADAAEVRRSSANTRQRTAEQTRRRADETTSELSEVRRRRASGRARHGDLESMTRDQLYRLARDVDVAGRSKMSRSELVDALS